MYLIKDLSLTIQDQVIFDQVTLEIEPGKCYALVGENGVGKSTFLKLLCHFQAYQSGEILFEGKPLDEYFQDAVSQKNYYRRLGVLFQDVSPQLFNRTVAEELAFGPNQLGLSIEDCDQRVADVAKQFQLEDLLDKPPFKLSGGEQKKVAFASILTTNPDIYLLDEPFNDLSQANIHQMTEMLKTLKSSGKTLLIVSHQMDELKGLIDHTLTFTDHTIVLQ